jgi:putative transposase
MRELFILIAHLLVTLAKLGTRGGLGAVAAESLAVKHQLLIMKRAQRRAPNLTSWDRLVLGVCALLVSHKRLNKMAVILKPSTLLWFHHALVKRKYRLLYSPRKRRRPGPKGPSKELIGAVIEMKRRNPRFGCRKIAEQISRAFAVEINKDVVRRILIRHYRPVPGGDGPSWLTVIGHAKDSLWSVDFFRCESILLKSYWVMVVMDVFTRRVIGFGVAAADLEGPVICQMFNRAIAKQTPPRCLSSDHDPLFRFHRWLANLRVLEVDEIKAVPCTPRSHAFVERLMGRCGASTSIGPYFGTKATLSGSSRITRPITTNIGVTLGWPELRRLNGAARPHHQSQTLSHIPGGNIAKAYFRPVCGELLIFDTNQQFATHRSFRGVACSPEAKPAPSGANGNTVDRYRLKPLQEAIVRPIRESEAESKRKSRLRCREREKVSRLFSDYTRGDRECQARF